MKRIGGVLVVVVVVEDDLGERAKKNYFHTRKKFRFSMRTRVRYQLTYPENAHFPIFFLFAEIAQGMGKREYADLKE
jgi:hypothetical protein